MIIKCDSEMPESAMNVAIAFAKGHPRDERGIGVHRCVIYRVVLTSFAAYWTKTMLIVRQIGDRA